MQQTRSEDLKYWVALNRTRVLGAVRARRLEARFGSAEQIWRASLGDIKAAGIKGRVARNLVDARALICPDDEMASLDRAGVTAVHWGQCGYPPRLKEIPDPPPVLYVKGQMLPEDELSVAMVGTRNPTGYGRTASAHLAGELASAGLTIVSGLALGIDGIAHKAALDAGRRTIAVVANGLDIVYPREHSSLAGRISESGAVVSEVPLGIRPDSRSFPRRNRLISGISLGTVVVEAGETSGARWTVHHALEQDREVFCVPGSIFSPASRLTNRLIKEGAKLVENGTDVLEELNLTSVARQAEMDLEPATANRPATESPAPDPTESRLLGALSGDPVHIDDIVRSTGLATSEASSVLTMMELKGWISQVGCMHYVRTGSPGRVVTA